MEMDYLISIISTDSMMLAYMLMIICSIFNRLRGTGVIHNFGTINNLEKYTFNQVSSVNINLVWNHVYGLFIASLLGAFTHNFLIGLIVLIGYLIGESKGWGEWVGGLTSTKGERDYNWLKDRYDDKEGKGFPFIFAITNFFIKENDPFLITLESKLNQYFKHITLALILRGMYWWSLVYFILFYYNYITLIEYLTITILLGITFPIACYLGNITNLNGHFSIINYSKGWENQELYYGIFQGMILGYVVSIILNL